jgi:hypothetical protein
VLSNPVWKTTSGDGRAAVLLFARYEPKYLPYLVPLAQDKAWTIPPQPANLAAPLPSSPFPQEPPVVNQTVGQVIGSLVHEYLIVAGDYGIEESPGRPGFDTYWARRQDRADCAGWIFVALNHGQRADALRRVNKLPEKDRVFTPLWLRQAPLNGQPSVTDAELTDLCKKLGPEPLLRMRQRKVPSDAPDLDGRTGNQTFYSLMMMFILKRAGQLLRPEDADALLDVLPEYRPRGLWPGPHPSRDGRGPRARRRRGGLHDELVLQRGARPGPDPRPGRREPRRLPHGPPPRPRPADRKLVAALVADRRLADLDWHSLAELVHLANVGRKRPVLTEEELARATHPLGGAAYHFERDRGRKDFPKETERLEATLSRWRAALRQEVR